MIRTSTSPTRVRFTRDDYHRMARAGILPPQPRVELLDGEIIRMSPINPPHGSAVDRLNDLITPKLKGRAVARIQGALALARDSEPEPDFMLLKPQADFYAAAHPRPEDVLLLIEVSESSIDYDLGSKLRAYARAGIVEFWVFDLNRGVLIVHRSPEGDAYADVQTFDRSAIVNPRVLPDIAFGVGSVLPEMRG
ncbi:MAG: hypothetical protein BroJett003_20340 [Planctomycetota bacterium]|nr:MAG: hypothetical protein BroJett003_20340 [Planctomycetota bacterium]